jgi:DNA primase
VATAAIQAAVIGREQEVLDGLGIQLNSRHKHIRCPYPAHIDNRPSWRWDASKRRAYCTCIRSDSLLDVVCKVKGVDFPEAKIAIAEMIGRSDLICHRAGSKRRRGTQDPGDNTATAQHPVGCTLAGYAKAKRVPADFLKSLGLTDITYCGQPAVKIPYLDANGAEIEVRFRVALDGGDKFRWRKGDKAALYGLDRLGYARDAKAVTVVEGESDCHTLWNAGFPAIGLPGAGNWNEHRDAEHFAGIDTIYVVIEPDLGGESVCKWLANSKLRDRVRLIRLDSLKDASQLYLDDASLFAQRWKAALEKAVPWRDDAERKIEAARKAAWDFCQELARQPDILAEVVDAVKMLGLVGEERAVKLIYLAMTTL